MASFQAWLAPKDATMVSRVGKNKVGVSNHFVGIAALSVHLSVGRRDQGTPRCPFCYHNQKLLTFAQMEQSPAEAHATALPGWRRLSPASLPMAA